MPKGPQRREQGEYTMELDAWRKSEESSKRIQEEARNRPREPEPKVKGPYYEMNQKYKRQRGG